MYLPVTDRSPATAQAVSPKRSGEMFATFINLSGRRRFTSQRVVLFTVLAANHHPESDGIAEQALDMFRDAHTALIKGDNNTPAVLSAPLHDAYFGSAKGNEKIMNFIGLAERTLFAIAAGWRRQVPVLVDELVASSSSLLTVLDSLTTIYEQEARLHAQQIERQLRDALDEIRVISKQAQVVAMNARVVAARAGSAGSEFSVVASQMIVITSDMQTVFQTSVARELAQ